MSTGMMNTKIKKFCTRLFPPEYSYAIRSYAGPGIVRVTTYKGGSLPGWKEATELAVNVAIVCASTWLFGLVDGVLAVIWLLVAPFALFFCPRSLRFSVFKVPPSTRTVTFESANIPAELVNRYVRASEEFLSIAREIDEHAKP